MSGLFPEGFPSSLLVGDGVSGSCLRASNPHKFLGDLNFYGSGKNVRNLRMAQSRHFGCPSRSRSQHWNPGGARCLSSASVAQMLAAASIKVMDALFGFLARNDAECCKRELLGRSWRRDWGMRDFRSSSKIEDLRKFGRAAKKREDRMLGACRAGRGTSVPLWAQQGLLGTTSPLLCATLVMGGVPIKSV